MKAATLGSVTISAESPAIIASLTGAHLDELRIEIERFKESAAQVAEWRIDCLTEPAERNAGHDFIKNVVAIGRELRRLLSGTPLLVTFRTAAEGGNQEISDATYAAILSAVCEDGFADGIDVEAFRDRASVGAIISAARRASVTVVASFHDFESTPPKSELIERFTYMSAELNVDVLKIAVMPRNPDDVLTLLGAAQAINRAADVSQPVIAISMGTLGLVSRVAGHVFGSAATFASIGSVSAPGQIDAHRLAAALQLFGE